MLEIIKTESQAMNPDTISHPAYEVYQFMENFFEAVHKGSSPEIETYFSDEIEPFKVPRNAKWTDRTLIADDNLATFSCALKFNIQTALRMTCVLDKSEGHWQIIHGKIESTEHSH